MITKTSADIIYPETDGMPLPDGIFQEPLFIEIVSTIETFFKDLPSVLVSGNTFIYYVEGDPRHSVSPDCYVTLGLSEEALKSIERNNVDLLWEVGRTPDFILEIGSESTSGADLGAKRRLYEELGAGEYWRFDATGGDFYGEALAGEFLEGGEYRRFELHVEPDGRTWGLSPALGLELWWDEGRLRLRDAETGEWLLSQEEERAARLDAEAENRRLMRMLRELGPADE